MESIKTSHLSDLILKRIQEKKEDLAQQFASSKNKIGYFYLDHVLPDGFAMDFQKVFPSATEMVLKKSIRENKYVAAQMDKYNNLLEQLIYAFQDPRIIKEIEVICGIENAYPDDNLYAGGISMMGKNQFLNPHLDNSHDKDRNRWRVLNLLYYVTPNWKEEYGGNLELWPNGLTEKQTTIHSKFNRLVVMATHNQSLHSVSPVTHNGFRCCVSNYYFSDEPLQASDKFHVTSFRARPGEKAKDKILQADTWLRMNLRKVFKKGVVENKHVYKKDEK
jgi:Rps23 Pro-64 3,4-dihydroxylase Tpa1-like proline 4-hydroxylase